MRLHPPPTGLEQGIPALRGGLLIQSLASLGQERLAWDRLAFIDIDVDSPVAPCWGALDPQGFIRRIEVGHSSDPTQMHQIRIGMQS